MSGVIFHSIPCDTWGMQDSVNQQMCVSQHTTGVYGYTHINIHTQTAWSGNNHKWSVTTKSYHIVWISKDFKRVAG